MDIGFVPAMIELSNHVGFKEIGDNRLPQTT